MRAEDEHVLISSDPDDRCVRAAIWPECGQNGEACPIEQVPYAFIEHKRHTSSLLDARQSNPHPGAAAHNSEPRSRQHRSNSAFGAPRGTSCGAARRLQERLRSHGCGQAVDVGGVPDAVYLIPASTDEMRPRTSSTLAVTIACIDSSMSKA